VLHELAKVGAVIDAALASGANEVPQVSFQATNTDSARRVAVANAVKNARADAQAAASAAGGRLGRVVHLNVGGRSVYGGMAYNMAEAAPSRAVTTPISPSSVTVNAQVSVEWEFIEGH
jgi:uncharacterized protein YggE